MFYIMYNTGKEKIRRFKHPETVKTLKSLDLSIHNELTNPSGKIIEARETWREHDNKKVTLGAIEVDVITYHKILSELNLEDDPVIWIPDIACLVEIKTFSLIKN